MLGFCTSLFADVQASEQEHQGLESVTLQLKWKPQFQFAGYYAALEQGFYEQEGLDVTIRPLSSERDIVSQVVSGEIEYAVGGSGILAHYANGSPIKALA
ncbi:MAG: histidine kinase, partial [Methylophaga sp.]|nr:histidine kinase [Methylophaga sp.]